MRTGKLTQWVRVCFPDWGESSVGKFWPNKHENRFGLQHSRKKTGCGGLHLESSTGKAQGEDPCSSLLATPSLLREGLMRT